jgi:cbb3-type cytochrome oxidase maturation protein
MEILFLLIPLSLALAFLIGIAAWYAVGAGQFDDLTRPALDVIADDDRPAPAGSFDAHQARARPRRDS